ncbi:MAG: hypothetical protein Q4A28_00790 [Brachymonas sp.]|nr:hypothetical protein [Brachymonas sp.]
MRPETAAAQPPDFRPGFRLSWLDVGVLLLGAGAAWALWRAGWALAAAAVVCVICHFFLFCNVLRMARVLELIWAAVFVAVMAAGVLVPLLAATLGWGVLGGIVACTTTVLAWLQTRRPDYHGVGWRCFNPGLPVWFAAQRAAR